MTLEPGRTLAHFRLVDKLGEGGMGQVWAALDTTLDRRVALKFLPAAFAGDAERLGRFEREARLLAALNHANIAAIHGMHTVEESGRSLRFLSMEHVEGEDLSRRLARGPLPLDEALDVARQIAAGFEAAHEKGVIHRDLKPANVMLTPGGEVKILDFGLAKALAGDPAVVSASGDPSVSPTITSAGTAAGVILGSAAYMSPEQAKGRPVDRRADTWAFGCVLYEILTGARAFKGDTAAEVLGAVLHQTPDLSQLPDTTPPNVRRLIERCLRKNPKDRLRDLGDAGIEIADAIDGGVAAEPDRAAIGGDSGRHSATPWVIAVIALSVILAGLLMTRSRPTPPEVTRTTVTLPSGALLDRGLSLSSDGRRLVFSAIDENDRRMLYVRDLERFELEPIEGSEGARESAFSPDDRWVAFSSDGKLKKVPIEGGAVIEICDGAMFFGAVWAPDDRILFSEGLGSVLFSVPASGGVPQPVTNVDPQRGEVSHGRPHLLPDGKTVLFTIGTERSSDIGSLSLETGQQRVLMEGAAGARHLPSGHLVFSKGGTLRVVPFDAGRHEVLGAARLVLDGLRWSNTGGLETALFDVSRGGTLVYASGQGETRASELVVVERDGTFETLDLEPGAYFHPRVSPDGRRIAVTQVGDDGTGEVWIIDLERGSKSPLTLEGANYTPLWTPDGKRVAYVSNGNMAWRAIDGSSPPEILLAEDVYQRPISFSPDGKLLSFVSWTAEGGEIGVLSLQDRTVTRLARPFKENTPVFSPDGGFLAYVSNESGRAEIYVQAYPGPSGKWLVSTEGGRSPVWSPAGDEILYRNGDRIMAVAVEPGDEPRFGRPRMLFEADFYRQVETPNFDVIPGTDRLVMVDHARLEIDEIQVVQHWLEELGSR